MREAAAVKNSSWKFSRKYQRPKSMQESDRRLRMWQVPHTSSSAALCR